MLPQIDLAFDDLVEGDFSHFEHLTKQAVSATANNAAFTFPEHAELSVLIAGDARLQTLNKQWRGKDKPTNVLSFPSSDIAVGEVPEPLLGDIVISLDTVNREAAIENKPFDDHFRHLVIHGLLHLFGYDHETDDEAEQMESLEIEILNTLNIANPY